MRVTPKVKPRKSQTVDPMKNFLRLELGESLSLLFTEAPYSNENLGLGLGMGICSWDFGVLRSDKCDWGLLADMT